MKKHQFTIFVLAVVFATTAITGYGQTCPGSAGCLDLTFGSGGKVFSMLAAGVPAQADAVAIQTDGKIVVAAESKSTTSGAYPFYVLRFNIDGSIDSTFGSGGSTQIYFSSNLSDREYPMTITIQDDGKILVGGEVPAIKSSGIARLNSDGSLDSTFGSNGKVILNYFKSEMAQTRSIVVQPNGYIAVAGTSNLDSFAFARFKPNGSLDNSFNGTGKLVVRVAKGSAGVAYGLKLQSDGKLVAVGSGAAQGKNTMFAAMRVDANGTLDSSFGSGGKVFTDFGGSWSRATSVLIDSSGRIVAGGFLYVADNNEYFAFVRYLSDGQPDYSFGSGGKLTCGTPGFNRIYGIVMQPDGKIIGGGQHHAPNQNDDFVVLRMNPNGDLDTTFGNNGISLTDFGGMNDGIFGIAMQTDEKVVGAGFANGFLTSNIGIGLARYLP